VSPDGYAHMTHMLSSLAAGKLILVLEVHLFNLYMCLSVDICVNTSIVCQL